ncbi:dynamin family protein [Paenisporosarcina sp. TG20]|uniref:dynamin family protein n=1 Tax=Paenisporosarcina sp. TG20 TaxID=1211706 RepID=UPI0002EA3BB8|nr:dynamin family protein [Paenisporosarcina sp. TG20]
MQSFDDKIEQLLNESSKAYTLFQQANDVERTNKTLLFSQKLMNREFTIGFAGHFSAGKSTMINALTGEQLLPSSPIPTSANIVKIHKSSEDFAVVYMQNQQPVKFTGDFDFEMVKEFCKDGEAVSQIEIGHESSVLPEGITVMDTPGVDSTDDAHRMSTESSLHLADIVFYMMDYNHVQSELNFDFTKQLMKYNENVYLIVNQIDKHRENELTFENFKDSVYSSFKAWGVIPKGIFFTSLKDTNHVYNDFEDVQKIVVYSMKNWQQQLVESSVNTLKKLHDEHTQYLLDEIEECRQTFSNVLSKEEWAAKEEVRKTAEVFQKQSSLLTSKAWIETFEHDRKILLDNANIMPYELREKLKLYLETKQADFKVGLFFSVKKTEVERNNRGVIVEQEYHVVIQSQIAGHMRSLMKQSLKNVGLLTDEHSLTIDQIEFHPSLQLIDNQILKGSLVTADAVLNFANRVADATKKWFIQQTEEWKKQQAQAIEDLPEDESGLADSKSIAYQEKVLAIDTLEQLYKQLEDFTRKWSNPPNDLQKDSFELVKKWESDHLLAEQLMIPFNPSMIHKNEHVDSTVEEKEEVQQTEVVELSKTLLRARYIAEQIEHIQGFSEVSRYLQTKSQRLEKQDFTIALFGAFSAGKSSFSNALLGANVLPVSPNPTTAAINRIKPVTEHQQHETAEVQLKTHDQLFADVASSFQAIGLSVASLEEAFIKSSKIEDFPLQSDGLQVHKAFIYAFKEGYSIFKQQLGSTLRVDRNEFKEFVAQENKSCFVDTIDFFYDCPITRMGVTLVDTPGADSINARHTGVAFDYIRNADAILFITYYNHAFARADREFLIQLGRVKDSFELDKMFFIVNAIDLADNQQEAEDVKNYVMTELQHFGIRFPRVYGVSSLQALQEKEESINLNSGLDVFEEAFEHFLSEDLKAMAIISLAEETDKTVKRLDSLINQTETNLLRKEDRLQELSQLEQTIRQRFSSSAAGVIEKNAYQELDELLYYVLQRVYYRYPEFYKESYNPSLFANSNATDALIFALKETLGMLSFDFEQEMRVTNFRLNQWIKHALQQRQKDDMLELKEANNSFSFVPYEMEDAKLLDFEGPFSDIAPYTHVKSYYKNNKSFFEKNDKEKLRDALQAATRPEAQNYLSEQNTRLREWVSYVVDLESEGLRQHLLHESLLQINSERIAMKESSHLEEWKTVYAKLSIGGVT